MKYCSRELFPIPVTYVYIIYTYTFVLVYERTLLKLELSRAHTPRALQPLWCSIASIEALHSELEL